MKSDEYESSSNESDVNDIDSFHDDDNHVEDDLLSEEEPPSPKHAMTSIRYKRKLNHKRIGDGMKDNGPTSRKLVKLFHTGSCRTNHG